MNEGKFIERLKQAASEARSLANGYKNLSPTRLRLSIDMAKILLDEAADAANEPDPVAFLKLEGGFDGNSGDQNIEFPYGGREAFEQAPAKAKADGEFPMPVPHGLPSGL